MNMSRKRSLAALKACLLGLCFLLLPALPLIASPPQPFSALYEAQFSGLKASADRSLSPLDAGEFQMSFSLKVKFLGQTLTAIDESSRFRWRMEDERILPLHYEFVQTGIAKRSRSLVFNWNERRAAALVEAESANLILAEPALDNLSAYLELRKQLAEGHTEIAFPVVDKAEIKTHRYRLIAREILTTELGDFRAAKLEKVRASDSERHTEVWLAEDWDFLLLKLFQREKRAVSAQFLLREAHLDGVALRGLEQ